MSQEPDRASFGKIDWRRALSYGAEKAVEQARAGDDLKATDAMWALLREAAEVSRIVHSSPPHTGLPGKSAMPDAANDVSAWHLMMSYINGTLEEKPEIKARPPQPSPHEVTRAEAVLQLWHDFALRGVGDWKRMRKAVYLKACGVPDRKVRAVTGYTRQRIHSAKVRAMQDMLDAVRGC